VLEQYTTLAEQFDSPLLPHSPNQDEITQPFAMLGVMTPAVLSQDVTIDGGVVNWLLGTHFTFHGGEYKSCEGPSQLR
jgi:hypothetical protein